MTDDLLNDNSNQNGQLPEFHWICIMTIRTCCLAICDFNGKESKFLVTSCKNQGNNPEYW